MSEKPNWLKLPALLSWCCLVLVGHSFAPLDSKFDLDMKFANFYYWFSNAREKLDHFHSLVVSVPNFLELTRKMVSSTFRIFRALQAHLVAEKMGAWKLSFGNFGLTFSSLHLLTIVTNRHSDGKSRCKFLLHLIKGLEYTEVGRREERPRVPENSPKTPFLPSFWLPSSLQTLKTSAVVVVMVLLHCHGSI